MPFIIRKIEPHYIGRGHVPQDTTSVEVWPIGAELGAITNGALATTLKQLASLLAKAEDIFHGLTIELTDLANRGGILRNRIDQLDNHLTSVDPRKTPVPESDICSFAARKIHYKATQEPTTGLFVSVTRPKALRELYEAAAVIAIRNLDSLRRERDGSALDMYMCTPVLGKRRRRDQSLDIESRVPAILDDLRKWTSSEALGDITVSPDCMSRILQEDDDDAVDHKLPSPEERVQAIALKFPAEIVAVDVSGRGFARMSLRRKSLLGNQTNQISENHNEEGAVKRRSRLRRPRGNRRNTIAGTDSKEIKQAINTENHSAINGDENLDDAPNNGGTVPKLSGRGYLSTSIDILDRKNDGALDVKWNFDALKAWGRSRLKRIGSKTEMTNRSNDRTNSKQYTHNSCVTANEEGMKLKLESSHGNKKNRSSERKPSLSSLSGKSACSSTILSTNTVDNQRTDCDGVILRESAAQKRERRKGNNNREDPLHSSSGNWSASSESGRASVGSETTISTTHPTRSTSTTSTGTCSTKMSQGFAKRFRCRDASTSSSVTSEGTLTPDIIHDIGTIPFSDEIETEGETCSVYSCDTEGYYTSFHMDSGLKTLREEELVASVVQQNLLVKSNDNAGHILENEYELFGRGSTSTTTSSAGTVCTALMAPQPPERKSSLTVVAMVHGQNKSGDESPDSGHNTSSSPVESTSSPACCTARSCSELEYSESSDLEGCDRIERIRSKTAISTSRIPSMCVITPPGSDDEQQRQQQESSGSVLMFATVGTSQMEVINVQNENLYATVRRVDPKSKPVIENVNESSFGKFDSMDVTNNVKIKSFSSVLEKLRCALPIASVKNSIKNIDSGDYVTIADVRNNNDKCHGDNANLNTYANTHSIAQNNQRESEYISLNDLPIKSDSSLDRKRHGARVTLDSEGKVIYASDSLKRRRGAHTTFNPGPFVKDTLSSPSMLTRSPTRHRPVIKSQITSSRSNEIDNLLSTSANKPVVIRATKSIQEPVGERGEREQRQIRGAYVNIQSEEDDILTPVTSESMSVHTPVTETYYHFDEHHHASEKYHERVITDKSHQYHTMPNTKIGLGAFAVKTPPRSVTPDIMQGSADTRGNFGCHIGTPRFNQMKMPTKYYDKDRKFANSRKNMYDKNHQVISSPLELQNRHLASMSVNAVGYKFFASSPTKFTNEKWHEVNGLMKNSPTLSPIVTSDELHDNFSNKENNGDRTLSENDLDKIISTNNVFSTPPKSTMSNEELFSAIYKSKRKLNIKNRIDVEPLNPGNATTAHSNVYLEHAGSRHSWSPESPNVMSDVTVKNVTSNLTTARRDFKRLLLQQSAKNGPNRLSAAEQLKLSRQQQCSRRNQLPMNTSIQQYNSPLRALSPRAAWKFQTPRSDVLSSTIIEDTVAEEKAMKPFQQHLVHNTSIKARTTAKRQLDLSGIMAHGNKKILNRVDMVSHDDRDHRLPTCNRQLCTDYPIEIPLTYANCDQHNFRARSESPSQAPIPTINRMVSRSPSAPALETAL